MNILDDLGKKVTQMSQDAVAMAKNVTDQAKYHGQINEEEKKIKESYRRIGELFYGVRGTQDLPEYQTLMDEIDAAKERITELKYLLQAAKGMVTCPSCGAGVSVQASFCPNCGARMPQPETESSSAEESVDAAEAADDAAETANVTAEAEETEERKVKPEEADEAEGAETEAPEAEASEAAAPEEAGAADCGSCKPEEQ